MSDLSLFKDQLKKRTKKFAHDCVKFSLDLPNDQLGRHISGQLIRCSTSVAANYRASCIAQTVPVLISKMSIAIEEVDESEFWIEFALDEGLNPNLNGSTLMIEANEIASILIKSRMTLQNNSHK
jgi:four helix bundle protein